jgi:hypothetical protein
LSQFWETNLRALAAQYPGLAKELASRLEAAGEDPSIRLENAASGLPALIAGGLYIHSPRDPLREARRAVEAAAAEAGCSSPGAVILLGFGLGYAAEAAMERWPRQPLLILERRPAVLRAALQSRDLTGVFQAEPLMALLGEDAQGRPLRASAVIAALGIVEKRAGASGGPLIVVRNRGLMTLDKDWYDEAERHIRTWVSKDEVNQATLRRFGKRWVSNLAKNREAVKNFPGISSLEGLLKGRGQGCGAPDGDIPAFLAAAGPSLDETGPLLREISRRCLVIAVDTSLRFLLQWGADPDFAVVVDPQFWNARHLDRAPAPKTCLIAESAVYPPVLRHPFARVLLRGSLFPLGRFIEDRVDPKGALGAGGSVATTAWDFARHLGASSLWIAGLDLSFPGLKTHFKGARFEERALAESNRFVPAETRSVRALRDGRPFKAPSAGGGEVLTDRRLSLYAAWFENRFRLSPYLQNRSLSPSGLAIEGLVPASMEELLALPIRREEISARLEAAFAQLDGKFTAPQERQERAVRYQRAFSSLLSGLERIRALAEEAAAASESAPSAGTRERVLAALDRTNRLIMDSEVKDVAGFLFPPVGELEQDLKTAESDPYGRHLELSARLYRALAQAADCHLTALSRDFSKKQ